MANQFALKAELREEAGKAASRRLRRAGRVPAVLYGGNTKALSLSLDHDEILHNLRNEAFHSHVLAVKVGRKSEHAILKDVHMHPFKPNVLHVDLMRVVADHALQMMVPLHFIGAETSPGVKAGGVFSRNVVEIEISCLPKDLPEFIEIDVSHLEIGDAIHLSEVALPEGVKLVHELDSEHDMPVVAIHHARVTSDEELTVEVPEEEVPAASTESKPSESE